MKYLAKHRRLGDQLFQNEVEIASFLWENTGIETPVERLQHEIVQACETNGKFEAGNYTIVPAPTEEELEYMEMKQFEQAKLAAAAGTLSRAHGKIEALLTLKLLDETEFEALNQGLHLVAQSLGVALEPQESPFEHENV